MIRPFDRKIAALLVRIGVWKLQIQFRCVRLRPRKGSRWLWTWMRARQSKEDRPYHHAPACPANRWSGQELVLQQCNCGAVKYGIVSSRSAA
jgi:hypothetical protein